jgi:hypothetical protein
MADTIKIPGNISHFFDLLGEWDYSLPLTTQWTLAIKPEAGNGLFNIIQNYTQTDVNSFFIPPSIQQKLLGEKAQPSYEGIGLYYAQSVKMSKESFTPTYAGIDGMAGYLKGVVGGDRMDMSNRHLSIDFLETNVDFLDGLIRPWIITASYKGLINLGRSKSIKSDIFIVEYTRSKGAELKPIKKIHIYTGCVPIDVQERTLKYDSEEVIIRNVNWIFESYTYRMTQIPTSMIQGFDLNAASNLNNII